MLPDTARLTFLLTSDTSDDVSLRKRAEAMDALTRIEIEFARLRDRLYMERMADIEKERIGVESGKYLSSFSNLTAD